MDIEMLDASGEPLIIGGTYGYTISSNGIKTIKIGELVKIGETSVRIKVDTVERFYSVKGRKKVKSGKTNSVSSYQLFPIHKSKNVDEVDTSHELRFCESCGNIPWKN